MFEVVPVVEAGQKMSALLEEIRAENPEHWPYGLGVDHFESGDLFAIQKMASEDPIGFVGWQTRNLGPLKVGMYAIGVLPEWRGFGVAKQAVAQVLQRKSASVDCVAALIIKGNGPSKHLADSLGVPALEKSAGIPGAGAALRWLAQRPGWVKNMAGGYAGTAYWDQVNHPNDTLGSHLTLGLAGNEKDPSRLPINAFNFLLSTGVTAAGRAAGHKMLYGATPQEAAQGAALAGTAMGQLGLIPAKDRLIQAGPVMNSVSDSMKRIADKPVPGVQEAPLSAPRPVSSPLSPWAVLAGAGLLAGGIGVGAHMIRKAIQEKAEAPVTFRTEQGGRLRVSLPTPNKDDAQTVVDIPFDQIDTLPPTLLHRLGLDAKRRLYAETKKRIRHRGAKLDLQVEK